jgi:hypothetical protein
VPAIRAMVVAVAAAAVLAGCQTSGNRVSTGGPVIEPAGFIGRSEGEVTGSLGQPDSARSELDAEVWQYAGPDCVVDFFLATEGSSRVVAHAEARNRTTGAPLTACAMS